MHVPRRRLFNPGATIVSHFPNVRYAEFRNFGQSSGEKLSRCVAPMLRRMRPYTRRTAANSQRHAAVDGEAPPRRIAGLLAREPRNEPGDLIRVRRTLERKERLDRLDMLSGHVRERRSRLDVVHRDAAAREIYGRALDHDGNGGLRHRVHARARVAAAHRGITADRDDAAALAQLRGGRLNGEKHAAHVDAEHAIEVLYAYRPHPREYASTMRVE